jgi:glycosyltransferase involved in cell wall biosynthesis
MVPGLVSLVVASYNHAEYLHRRMESLIDQTYQNIEILVIEDCSPDNSLEVLRKYEFHPKFRLIVREKNGGWVTVSNQGVEESSGEFVLFANCDDDCDPRMVERLVLAMRMNPTAGIAFTRSLLVDENDNVLMNDFVIRERAFRKHCANDTLISGAQMGRYLLHSCVIPNLSAALIRKECFSSVGLLSSAYRVCSDWDLFFRIAEKYNVAYVAEPLNKFRQHATTIRSVTKDRITYEEYFRLLLGQIRLINLNFFERCRFRSHVMYLWGRHLFSQPWMGVRNFSYHLTRVLHLDPMALVFIIPGLMIGIFKVGEKILMGLDDAKTL